MAKHEQKTLLSEGPKAEAEVDPPPSPPKLQENNIERVSQPEPIHKEKRQLTEEEVKANLRKTVGYISFLIHVISGGHIMEV